MTSLEGKVIAITGAASGIGKALAHLLAARDASISVVDNRLEPLDDAIKSIKQSTPDAKIFHKALDVTKASEVEAWLDETIKEFGGLHGAANLAGVLGPSAVMLRDVTDEDWNLVMNVNLKGSFNCMRAEIQRVEKDASIVNASSVAGLKGYPTGSVYSASKHAIIGLTKCAALEEGHRNIRVNCIAPGPIDTPMLQGLDSSIIPKVGLNRMGQPEEVAKLIAFLLSDESSYMTGACYEVDGGITA